MLKKKKKKNEIGVDGMWKKLLGNRTSTSLRVYVLVLFVDVGCPDQVLLFQGWGYPNAANGVQLYGSVAGRQFDHLVFANGRSHRR